MSQTPATSRPSHPSPHRRSRLAAGAAFFVQGLLFISLTTRLPNIQRRWDLDELAVSGLLLMVVLLAGLGSVAAEVVAHRASSAMVVRLGLLVAAGGFTTLLTAAHFEVFVAGLAVYGLALGLVDASSNMQAITVEHRYGRPILPSFHAFWTAGGIAGTLVTLATADVALGPLLLPLTLLPLLALAAPFVTTDRLPATATKATDVPDGPDEPGVPVVPWRRIALLGLAMVLFYMVDTAATTWGPVYLDTTLAAPSGLTALATLPYLVATLVARTLADGLVDRHGAVWLLRVSGVVAAVALAVVVFAPTWVVAVLGFTLLGGAVATIAPLSFSAAGALAGSPDPAKVDQVVARFNQFNYIGALLGAVLTGAVGADNLRIGFAVPMVLVLGIIPLASSFSVVGRRGVG
ncbi:MFS transporter [Humibacillus sp. DSM 29435]|uniref:MFS transporter n=1 Tax=Humibacillus sp. DSM 29435 TaxID=1869167 RepID=UPI0008723350|nr:MFS transporter [Humibacillus sp. DSM 29435]OFE18962.1 MFS transporter [Humibacillus sp. DSM 29435]